MINDTKLLDLIKKNQPIKARELIKVLSKELNIKIERSEINSRLYKLKDNNLLMTNKNYEWFISEEVCKLKDTEPKMLAQDKNSIELLVPQDIIHKEANNSGFSYSSLEAVRSKLLDLSRKNSLLNFRFTKTSTIRFVECDLQRTLDALVSNATLTMVALKEPSDKALQALGYELDEEGNFNGKLLPEEWAKKQGINIDYDLKNFLISEDNRFKKQLQTLYFPDVFESCVRKLSQENKSSVEESGIHTLYLVFGFIEWFESRDSNESSLAPLITVPVDFKLSGNKALLTFKDDGESLLNLTFKEKLEHDFGQILPEYNPTEITLKDYFSSLIKLFDENSLPKWKVREFVCLTTKINFSKQVMYQDLDPSNWPIESSIENHPVIQKLFAREGVEDGRGSLGHTEEYKIDSIKDIETTFPLIYDADSSQHSALIDAVKGRNLVIEGPPGTGKSQTITNLIAACINNNLRVLFVAEKMAALNVVKNRLDRAGIGEFCLELHSHKANKASVLEDLNSALHRAPVKSKTKIDEEIKHVNSYKEQLNHYVNLMNTVWKDTGLTIAQIFSKATKLKLTLENDIVPLHVMDLDGSTYNSMMARQLEDRIKTIAEICQKIVQQSENDIVLHPWYGVVKNDISQRELNDFKDQLDTCNNALDQIMAECKKIESEVFVNFKDLSLSYDEMSHFLEKLDQFPDILESEDFALIEAVLENDINMDLLLCYQHCVMSFQELNQFFKSHQMLNKDTCFSTELMLKRLNESGYLFANKVSDLSKEIIEIKTLLDYGQVLHVELENLKKILPETMQDLANGSLLNLQEIDKFVKIIALLPEDLLDMRNDAFLRESIKPQLFELIDCVVLLKAQFEQLSIHFKLVDLPSVNVMKEHFRILEQGGLFSFLSSDWRNAKDFFQAYSVSNKISAKKLKDLVPTLIDYRENELKIKSLVQKSSFLRKIYQGVETNTNGLLLLIDWYKTLQTTYEQGVGHRRNLGKELRELSADILKDIQYTWECSFESNYIEFVKLHRFIQQRFTESKSIVDAAVYVNDTQKGYYSLLMGIEQALENFSSTLETLNVSLDDVDSKVYILKQENKKVALLSEALKNNRFLAPYISENIKIEDFTLEKYNAIARVLEIIQYIKNLPDLVVNQFKQHCYYGYFQKWSMLSSTSMLTKLHGELREIINQLDHTSLIDLNDWYLIDQRNYHGIRSKNNRALSHPNDLYSWQEFLKILEKEQKTNLSVALDSVLKNEVHPDQLLTVWLYSVYTQLGNEILKECEIVDGFSSFEQEGLRQRFVEADQNLLKLQRERIIAKVSDKQAPIGVGTGIVRAYTESSLIKHEISKKTRHLPIRTLLSRAQEAIQTLKPCFMMSPMSVAQYLEPGKYQFDIVIMDEASQIKPEDAIGAIARANSSIIVGDPKQLPPTSFFQKGNADVDEFEDDQTSVEVTESILDAVMPLFTNRRLRWHYRSRHEKLIEFSNYHFYDNDLVVFPSPHNQNDSFGIDYRMVSGLFLENINIKEAESIVKETIRLLSEENSKSIGIVAMNSKQSQLIEDLLESAIMSDPYIRQIYEQKQQSEEPIFIKNLENVQGDERDIIIISMTYGPKSEGSSTPQRFGPINSDVGWRRLNVLFTRAKCQMIIFSSMKYSDILIDGKKSRGVQALRDFLTYCETNQIASHVNIADDRGPDSDFEISVIKALHQYGYECRPQLGIAGYYLDLAVINPNNPGEYLLGIECDGATYHSAKSARDRDRLRQQVLEGLGWRIERIWSTDWFKHPEREIERIVNILDTLQNPHQIMKV